MLYGLYVLWRTVTVFTYDFDVDLDQYDEEGSSYTSPNGHYSAKVYYDYYGGAVGGVNVYVLLKNYETDEQRYIYRADAKTSAYITWEDDTTLTIHNADAYDDQTITLNVENELYDEFGNPCKTFKLRNYSCKNL